MGRKSRRGRQRGQPSGQALQAAAPQEARQNVTWEPLAAPHRMAGAGTQTRDLGRPPASLRLPDLKTEPSGLPGLWGC